MADDQLQLLKRQQQFRGCETLKNCNGLAPHAPNGIITSMGRMKINNDQ